MSKLKLQFMIPTTLFHYLMNYKFKLIYLPVMETLIFIYFKTIFLQKQHLFSQFKALFN